MLNACIYQLRVFWIFNWRQLFISPLCYKILNFTEATKSKTIEGPFSALFPLPVHTQTFLVLGSKT